MDGGEPGALEVSALGFSSLNTQRTLLVDRLRSLPDDVAIKALKLGPRQLHELERNRELHRSALLPALDRYTGVLYDGLDAPSLSPAAREFAEDHVVVHSALFGLLRAHDRIPAYRLSGTTSLGSPTLKSLWSDAISAELAAHNGMVIDLRSKGYSALGPAPTSAITVSVVTRDDSGVVRALNHFNKKAKGEFTRALVESRTVVSSVEELVEWGAAASMTIRPVASGVVELEV